MFANHIGNVTPTSELKAGDGVFLPYSVTRDTKTGKLFLKVVNPGAEARSVKIDVQGAEKGVREVKIVTLRANGPEETNTLSEPNKIVPETTYLVADFRYHMNPNPPASGPVTTGPAKVLRMDPFKYTFAPWSITVMELEAK
jgi:alpha-L-arabinofuranosidase